MYWEHILCLTFTGLNEWEDADILAQVLAASQQEYIENLKRTASQGAGPSYDYGGPSTSS